MPSLFRKPSVTMDPNLPTRPPPAAASSFPTSFSELQWDMVEYCLHCGVYCDFSLSEEQIAQRRQVLDECIGKLEPDYQWGRIWTKMCLAALAFEVAAQQTLPEEGTAFWKGIRESLTDDRNLLVRKDANFDWNDEQAEEDESPNPQVVNLPMFTDEYDSIIQLINIHGTVAKFRKDLRALQDSPKMSDEKLIKKIEHAVDGYKKTLSAIKTNCDMSSLTKFLLSDLYKESSNKNASSSRLLARLVDDLNEAISDVKQEYAWPNLREQIMSLVKRWYQQVLSPPTLVECGYRGSNVVAAAAAAAAADDISVSDWGGGGNEEEEEYEPEPLTQPPENMQVLRKTASEDDDQAYLTADEEEPEEKKPTEEGSPIVMPTIDEEDEEEEETPKKPPAKKKKADEKPRRSRRLASEDSGDDDEEEHEKENKKQTPRRRSPRRSRRLQEEDAEAGPLPSARRKKRVPTKSVAKAKKSDDEESEDEESVESPPPTAKKPAAKKASAKKAPSSAAKKRKAPLGEVWSDSSEDEDEAKAAPEWVAPTRRGSFPSAPASKKRKSTGGSSKKGGAGGRKRVPWTDREEKALIEGARIHGQGNWETIRRTSKGVLLSRSGQQLKDKWRNLEAAKRV